MNDSQTATKKKARPLLTLNTRDKPFEDREIKIVRDTSDTYIIQNHPTVTDITETGSVSGHKFGRMFFHGQLDNDSPENHSVLGDFYYIVQRSNGKEMQDTFKARPKHHDNPVSIFGVYDGHSTKIIADLLSNKLDDYIIDQLRKKNDVQTSIKEAFKQIELEVMNELEEHKPRGGSTALCAVILERTVHVGNLGDSQAILIQNEGIVPLSNLHDCFNQIESDQVEKRGGTILKNRIEGELAITRSIGDINYKRYMSSDPEIFSHEITEKDEYLVLGSDGFWNGLNPEETYKMIKASKEGSSGKSEGTDMKALGNRLIDQACKNIKTKKDNMTLMLVNLREVNNKKKGFF